MRTPTQQNATPCQMILVGMALALTVAGMIAFSPELQVLSENAQAATFTRKTVPAGKQSASMGCRESRAASWFAFSDKSALVARCVGHYHHSGSKYEIQLDSLVFYFCEKQRNTITGKYQIVVTREVLGPSS